mgnify:CR=1 FL=1
MLEPGNILRSNPDSSLPSALDPLPADIYVYMEAERSSCCRSTSETRLESSTERGARARSRGEDLEDGEGRCGRRVFVT